MDAMPLRRLRQSFITAVEATQAKRVLPPHLPPSSGRMRVVGAGKAAAARAARVEAAMAQKPIWTGLSSLGYALPTRRIRVVEAPPAGRTGPAGGSGDSAPCADSLAQCQILALISGSGSSLLTLPAEGLTLADLTAVNRALLACGAPIAEINCVRKPLTQTLGGRLAAASRAPVLALPISDVAGDDPAVIASGPCAPDPTTYADALALPARWGIAPPPRIMDHLQRGARGDIAERQNQVPPASRGWKTASSPPAAPRLRPRQLV